MMPFMTQPAVAPACYVPKAGIAARSLLLRADPAYLQRTPTVVGNRKLACLDLCVAPANQGTNRSLLVAGDSTSDYVYIDIASTDMLRVWIVIGGVTKVKISAVPVFRDVSIYHLRVVLDVENATAADRVRLYQDGTRLPVSGTLALVTTDLLALGNAVTHRIGRTTLSGYIDQYAGLMADLVLVSGAVPDVFGERNIHGVWVRKPKSEIQAAVASVGGFGTNGFHLDFSDPLNPGKDVSGQGNHWNAVGFDATGKDNVASTPGNRFATLNPLYNNVTVSDGGLRMRSVTAYHFAWSTFAAARARMEAKCLLGAANYYKSVGVALVNGPTSIDMPGTGVMYLYDGRIMTLVNGVITQTLTGRPSLAANTVVDVYLDDDAGTVAFRVDDLEVVSVALPAAGRWLMGVAGHPSYVEWQVNYGQRPWTYAGVAGWPTHCTDNLPEPEIKDPSEAFVQVATTGLHLDAGLRDATAHWSSGGWVEIIKRLDADGSWRWRFSDDPAQSVASDTQAAKGAAATLVSGANYVGLRLRIGQRYGVYTAEVNHVTGIATTVAHGLATPRNMVLVKRADAASDWLQWHPDLPAGNLLTFNSNVAAAPNSGITGIGGNSFQIGAAMPSGIYRVLVLAERPGFIALGKYGGGTTYPFAASDVAPLLFCQKRISGVGEHRIWLDATASGNPKPCLDINNAGVLDGTYSADLDCGGARPNTAVIEIGAAGESYVHLQIGRPVGGVCVAPATAR